MKSKEAKIMAILSAMLLLCTSCTGNGNESSDPAAT